MPAALRDFLLAQADTDHAMDLAARASDIVNRFLNDSGASAATSLLARGLIANAIVQVAGHWWADLQSLPTEDAVDTIASFVGDPPPGVKGVTFIDPTIVAQAN